MVDCLLLHISFSASCMHSVAGEMSYMTEAHEHSNTYTSTYGPSPMRREKDDRRGVHVRGTLLSVLTGGFGSFFPAPLASSSSASSCFLTLVLLPLAGSMSCKKVRNRCRCDPPSTAKGRCGAPGRVMGVQGQQRGRPQRAARRSCKATQSTQARLDNHTQALNICMLTQHPCQMPSVPTFLLTIVPTYQCQLVPTPTTSLIISRTTSIIPHVPRL